MSAVSKAPNSVIVFVCDAVGDKYCYSTMDIALEESAIKHVKWWMRQRHHIGFDGKSIPICRPLKIVVERYYDPSVCR